MLGHMIAAAGVVEVIACVQAMQHRLIPPTINYKTPDPACDLDYTPNEAQRRIVNVAFSNSLGFGGHNACIVFKKFAE